MSICELNGKHVTPLRYIIINQSQSKGRHVTLLRYIIMNQSIYDNISEWSDMSIF
jgi:hypothetical protein